MTRARNSTRSFSLVEVVMALGLIGFAMIAVLAFFPNSLASNRSSVKETRAAQLARAVFGTVDSQCATFGSVNCYGITLDLTSLSTMAEAPGASSHVLYASYPSPNQPSISSTQSIDSIYTIEMRFDNNPSLGSGVTPATGVSWAGKVSLVEVRVFGKERNDGPVVFFFLARNKG